MLIHFPKSAALFNRVPNAEFLTMALSAGQRFFEIFSINTRACSLTECGREGKSISGCSNPLVCKRRPKDLDKYLSHICCVLRSALHSARSMNINEMDSLEMVRSGDREVIQQQYEKTVRQCSGYSVKLFWRPNVLRRNFKQSNL